MWCSDHQSVRNRTLWALRTTTFAIIPGAGQEHVDSTTGVVLAPEVQPGSHQIVGTLDRTDVFAMPAEPHWE